MLKQSNNSKQRGETLIELLLAFGILSLALVTVMSTMNGGLESLSVNGQRSQTEALMRGQLAILQAAHQQAIKDPSSADWAEITSKIATSSTFREQAVEPGACTYTSNKNRLYFPTANSTSWTSEVDTRSGGSIAPNFGAPTPDGTALWIEAQHKPKDEATFSRGYYDFYIKSCWQGGGGVNQEAKMVTRLYDIEATTATPVYNNLVLSATDTDCANGSSGKISYTIRNDNSYPFGQVRVTIATRFDYTHPNLAPGQSITDPTPAGFPAADYMVRATVVSTGDYKEVPVTILPCPPPPILIAGSSHTACAPLYDWEVDERVAGRPTYGFLSNTGPYAYPCRTFPAPGPGTVFTCVNYDARYSPDIIRTGSYRMTLRYHDANCDNNRNETLTVAGYNYRVDVYKNGSFLTTLSLNTGAPVLSTTYDFGTLSPGDTIGVRWWNNRFIPPAFSDPDFVISSIRLEWR